MFLLKTDWNTERILWSDWLRGSPYTGLYNSLSFTHIRTNFQIRSGHRRLARSFNLCCRYRDDLIVFNNKKFLDYLKEIYPSQLTVENFFFFFLFKDVEKKVGLKSPKLHTPGKVGTCPPPLQKSGNLDTSNHNLTQPCGWGGGPGVVALATREQSAPIVP